VLTLPLPGSSPSRLCAAIGWAFGWAGLGLLAGALPAQAQEGTRPSLGPTTAPSAVSSENRSAAPGSGSPDSSRSDSSQQLAAEPAGGEGSALPAVDSPGPAGGSDPAGPTTEPNGAGPQPPSFLLISADRQTVDAERSVVVAEGNVEARFEGWRLFADRVEVIEPSRTVYATGRLRLYKGDQMLQASRLRYSQLEGSGELEDIYGVIDREGIDREVRALRQPGASPPASPDGEAFDRGFACPELRETSDERPLLQLVPPRRVPMLTMPAPAGCPGSPQPTPPRALVELLSQQPRQDETPAEKAPTDRAPIDQRVEGVRFRQAVDTSIKLNLVAVIDTEEETSTSGPRGAGIYRRPRESRGELNRLRFQASNLVIQGNRWSSREVAFTNDPFTPAQSWTIGYEVETQFEDEGITRIQARRTRIVLSNRVVVPGINRAVIGADALQLTVDADRRDREGIYLGYNLPPIRIGEKGKLELQPQFMVQRAIEGRTSSYTAPGKSLAGPRVNQRLRAGDLFGLTAALDVPFDRFRLEADTSVSTLAPDNLAAGTRSIVRLSTPLALAGHSSSQGQLFGSYRERVYNGSLGLQTVVYSYGGQLEGSLRFNPDPADPTDDQRRAPYFGPVEFDWRAVAGSYQATLFDTDRLDTQWRGRLNAGLTSSLRLWEASLDPQAGEISALRYSAQPVRPGLALNFGMASSLARYGDGDRQNTLTLFAGPALTLGRFRRPWFDYTQIALLVGGTLRDGASPFGFDRAVDLGTLSFRAAQQLYGPLVLEAGATVNIDSNSGFYRDVSYSYLELKLEQRSYELGVYYSPYDGIGGIRIRLNDFSFRGSGTPFVPRPLEAGTTPARNGPATGTQPALKPAR